VEVDQPDITFITPFGYFYYVKKLFGLNNAGATYQQCMQFCFKGHIGCNLEVFVDDIVVKSRRSSMSYPVPRKRERSLHTCAQDVQITRIITT
jgi:hypothetical protein